jgi:hypothetical protein
MPKGATAVAGALLFMSLLTLAGCAKDAEACVAAVTSWAATARLAGESWNSGLVPTPYTRRTFQAAEEGIAEAERDLSKAEDLPTERRDALERATGALRQAVSEARSAVDRKDRHAVRPALDRIAAAEKALSALSPKGGGGR